MDGFMLMLYGAGAGWIASRVTERAQGRLKKIGGGLMVGAAVLLGLKPVDH